MMKPKRTFSNVSNVKFSLCLLNIMNVLTFAVNVEEKVLFSRQIILLSENVASSQKKKNIFDWGTCGTRHVCHFFFLQMHHSLESTVRKLLVLPFVQDLRHATIFTSKSYLPKSFCFSFSLLEPKPDVLTNIIETNIRVSVF